MVNASIQDFCNLIQTIVTDPQERTKFFQVKIILRCLLNRITAAFLGLLIMWAHAVGATSEN